MASTESEQFEAEPHDSGPVDPAFSRGSGPGALALDLGERFDRWLERPDAEAPVRMGPYELLARIGEGPRGQVFRATKPPEGELAVVSVERIDGAENIARFEADVRARGRLTHPALAPLLGAGRTGWYAWIATAFPLGQSLAEVLVRGRQGAHVILGREAGGGPRTVQGIPSGITEEQDLRGVMRWFRDLACCLSELHDRGLAHRAVRPSNIIVDREGIPRLADFGHPAANVVASTASSLAYVSPEQVKGGYLALSPASDVYGLSVIFYEILTGHSFDREPGLSLRETIERVPFPPPSSVNFALPLDIDAVFRPALHKDPRHRLDSAGQLVRLIDAWESERPLGTVGRRHGRFVTWLGRHRIAVSLLSVAILIVAAMTAWHVHARAVWRDEQSSTLRSLLDRGLAVRAMETARTHAVEMGNSETFLELYREAVRRGARGRSVTLLKQHVIRVVPEHASEAMPLIGQEALIDLRYCQSEDLVFQVVFSELIRDEPQRALDRLNFYRQLVHESRLLLELKALALIQARRIGEYDGLAEDIENQQQGVFDSTVLCTRALRFLTEVTLRRTVWGEDDVRIASLLERASWLAGRVLEQDPEHVLARILRARASYDRGAFYLATQDLDAVMPLLLQDQREGVLLLSAAAHLLLASVPGSHVEREYAMGAAATQELMKSHRRAIGHLLIELTRAPAYAVVSRWIQEFIDDVEPWPELRRDFLELVRASVGRAYTDEDHQTVELLAGLLAQRKEKRFPRFEVDYCQIQNVRAWSKLCLVEEAGEEECVALVEQLRSIVDAESRRYGNRAYLYELEAAFALALASCVTQHPNVAKASWRQEAIDLLSSRLENDYAVAVSVATEEHAMVIRRINLQCGQILATLQ